MPATCWGHILDFKLATKKLLFYQSKEILFLSRWDPFSEIYNIIQKYKHKSQKSQDSEKMAWTKISTGYPSFHRFC